MMFKAFYHLVSQWHENPKYLQFSSTLKGNIILWLSVLLLLGFTQYLPLIPLMILTQLFPSRRLWIVGIGAGGLFLHKKFTQLAVSEWFWFAFDAGVILGFLYLFFLLAKSFSSLPRVVRNYPQIFLHIFLWCCILLTLLPPSDFRHNPSWAMAANLTICLVFFSFLIWRIGLMLYSGKRGSIKQTGFLDHLVYSLPYLGFTQVPYGKGLDYLLPKMAISRIDLAKSQLAGIKLLILAWIWQYTLDFMDAALFVTHSEHAMISLPDHLRLFHINVLVTNSVDHMPTMGVVWASLILDMVYDTTQLAITGHLIVGCLRLCGFYVFRNTYKPLLSTTLIDFWNRYYYYFKELLVDFFFFPAYLSFFKQHPKLRIFTATMASAFLGNFYYHLLQRFDNFIIFGTPVSYAKFSSYFFYAFVLGIAIFISILREQNQRGKPMITTSPGMLFLIRLRKIAGVWLFFSILRIWDHSNSSFMTDTTFFFAIFGIHF
ncbi:MAG: hypothetical protein H7839_11000 [Magnetococcus sp. YQC-5]